MIEKILNKVKKEYAIFFNEKGEQIEIKNISKYRTKNNFKHKNNYYLKDKKNFSHINIGNKTYYLYDYKYTNPIDIINDPNNEFIAENIYSIIETNILKDINRLENGILSNINPKTLIFIVGGLIAVYYLLSNGGI